MNNKNEMEDNLLNSSIIKTVDNRSKIQEETKKFNIQITDNKLDEKLFSYIETVFKNTYFERIYKGKMVVDITDYVSNEYIGLAEFIDNRGILSFDKKVTYKYFSYKVGDIITMYISFVDNHIQGKNKYAECKNIEITRDDIVMENGKYVYKNKNTGRVVNFDTNEEVVIDKISCTEGAKKFDINVHFA
jgi:hypothetical protein